MPIFEFECTACGKREDRLIKRSEIDEQTCSCEDHGKMIKTDLIQNTSFALKGRWFKTTKGY